MWDQVLSKLDHATTPQKAILLWHGELTSLQFISQAKGSKKLCLLLS